MKIFILFILILAISACQQNTSESKNQTVKPTATAAPVAAETPKPAPSKPQNKNYDGKGIVTKIDLKLVSVEINHEKIEGLMPAMTMEFFVAKKPELEKLKVGDKVDFVVEYKDGQEKIIGIKKAE
jgi:Cu/Ag efflux protein CusF